jgi:hypothetical protein
MLCVAWIQRSWLRELCRDNALSHASVMMTLLVGDGSGGFDLVSWTGDLVDNFAPVFP